MVESNPGVPRNILNHVDAAASKLIPAETVDSATDHLVHTLRSNPFQPLGNGEVDGRQLFLPQDHASLHHDKPYLRGDIKTRGHPVSKKGDGNLHAHEILDRKKGARKLKEWKCLILKRILSF